jgi:hypothetical protein
MALVVIGNADSPTSTASSGHPGNRALRTAAHRVANDLHMVQILSRKALIGDGLSPEVRVAVGEAFLLHVWSLREFFYGRRQSGRGVVAADFFGASTEWESRRPPLPTALGRDWLRLSGAVEPVSQTDPSSARKDARCPYYRLTTELIELNQAFVAALPPRQAVWFATAA